MPLINMSGSTGADTIAEPRIDPLIARDSEVTAAINAHLAAADPHPAYLSQAEGDARYRLASATIPENSIDSLIARDSEVAAAISVYALNTFTAQPRSGILPFDADLADFTGYKWIDGSAQNRNLPENWGLIFQVEPFRSTELAGLYRLQFFFQYNRCWIRQFSESPATWREL